MAQISLTQRVTGSPFVATTTSSIAMGIGSAGFRGAILPVVGIAGVIVAAIGAMGLWRLRSRTASHPISNGRPTIQQETHSPGSPAFVSSGAMNVHYGAMARKEVPKLVMEWARHHVKDFSIRHHGQWADFILRNRGTDAFSVELHSEPLGALIVTWDAPPTVKADGQVPIFLSLAVAGQADVNTLVLLRMAQSAGWEARMILRSFRNHGISNLSVVVRCRDYDGNQQPERRFVLSYDPNRDTVHCDLDFGGTA